MIMMKSYIESFIKGKERKKEAFHCYANIIIVYNISCDLGAHNKTQQKEYKIQDGPKRVR